MYLFFAKLNWPSGLFSKISERASKQSGIPEKHPKLRRASINVAEKRQVHERLPMVDYAEADFGRKKIPDLNSNLNWTLLNTFFALSLFYLVPVLICAVTIVAILDNYFYLEGLFHFWRVPGTPGREPASLTRWTDYSNTPAAISAARVFSLAFPVLSVPFALLYYAKNGLLWFDSQLHYLLLLVAIEHVLVVSHWIAAQLASVVDHQRLALAAVGESAFSRQLKAQAKAELEAAAQEKRLKNEVLQERVKWQSQLDLAKLQAEEKAQHGEASRSELIQRLTEVTGDLRAHWFQPMNMRTNLQLAIYWAIEQHILAKRFEQTQVCLPTPICDENDIFLSRYYLPKRSFSFT